MVLFGVANHIKEVNMTSHDKYSLPDVQVGDIVRVSLTENPTTGYRWQFSAGTDNASPIQILQDRYDLPNTNLMGASGTRIITVRVN